MIQERGEDSACRPGPASPRKASAVRAKGALRPAGGFSASPGAEGALVWVKPKFAKDEEEFAALRRATTAPAFAHGSRFDNGGPWAPAHRKRRADSQRRRSTILPTQTPKNRAAGPKHPGNKSGRGEQTAAAARNASPAPSARLAAEGGRETCDKDKT